MVLEELIRAVAEGKGETMPETVLAMLQARLVRLEPGARRILRVASIYGQTFWQGGLQAAEVEPWLRQLVDMEFIERHRESRFPAEIEYGFRHALMREAAYGLLSEAEQTQGHLVAGEFLEQVGERDLLVLAEHFQRGRALERAIDYYIRAADQALAANDLRGAIELAEHGIACGAQGEARGLLRSIETLAYTWSDDWNRAYECGNEALALIPPGSLRWCKLMGCMLMVSTGLGQKNRFPALIAQLAEAQPDVSARSAYAEGVAWLVTVLSGLEQRDTARSFFERLLQVGAASPDDSTVQLWVKHGHVFYVRFAGADPWSTLQLSREGANHARTVGDKRNELLLTGIEGAAQCELGQPELGESTLRATLALAERVHSESMMFTNSKTYLSMVLSERGEQRFLEEAVALAQSVTEDRRTNPVVLGMACGALAHALLGLGEAAEAEAVARRGCEVVRLLPAFYYAPLTALGQALLAQGNIESAKAVAREGLHELTQHGGVGYNELRFRLFTVEALLAANDLDAARSALFEAQDQLMLRAEKIPEEAARERFLSAVSENARLRELAKRWL